MAVNLSPLQFASPALLDSVRQSYAVGSPDTVRREMNAFIDRTGADELMIAGQIFEHTARLRSYEITAEVAQAAALEVV